MEAGFATSYDWSGATLAQPTASVTGFSTTSFTAESVTITASATQAVTLVFRLNFPGQPNQAVSYLIKNIQVCEPSSAKIGIAEIETSANIETTTTQLYPNPFSGETILHLPKGDRQATRIVVTDLSGATLKEYTAVDAEGNLIIGKELAVGMYFLQVYREQKVESYKLIKN